MSDTDLRELERVWRTTKNELDAERYLRARMANYDFPLRKMIETTIRSDRLMRIGIGAEERPVTPSNVIEYLFGVTVSEGARSDAECEMARMDAEVEELRRRTQGLNGAQPQERVQAGDDGWYNAMSARAETRAHARPRKGPGAGGGRP